MTYHLFSRYNVNTIAKFQTNTKTLLVVELTDVIHGDGDDPYYGVEEYVVPAGWHIDDAHERPLTEIEERKIFNRREQAFAYCMGEIL